MRFELWHVERLLFEYICFGGGARKKKFKKNSENENLIIAVTRFDGDSGWVAIALPHSKIWDPLINVYSHSLGRGAESPPRVAESPRS